MTYFQIDPDSDFDFDPDNTLKLMTIRVRVQPQFLKPWVGPLKAAFAWRVMFDYEFESGKKGKRRKGAPQDFSGIGLKPILNH